MPRTAEQIRHTEVRPNPAEGAPSEAVEYNETALEQLIEQAHQQVGAERDLILKNADARLQEAENKSGLDPQTRESVFTSGGFADRLKAAKRKIIALAQEAKSKISGMTGHKEALTEKKSDTKPVHLMDLDEYMAAHKRKGLDAVKEKAELARLKLKGYEKPQRLLGLVSYLKEHVVKTEDKTLKVEFSKRVQEREKYKKHGYSVDSIEYEMPDEKGNIQMRVSKKIPFSVRNHNLKDVDNLLYCSHDPVAVFEALRGLGHELQSYDISLYLEEVRRLVNEPKILGLLGKLQEIKDKITFDDYSFFESNGTSSKLRKLASSLEENTDIIHNLGIFSQSFGFPLRVKYLERYSNLTIDPDILAIVRIGIGKKFERHNEEYILDNLEVIKDSGMAKALAVLLRNGVDLNLNDLLKSYGGIEDQLENLATVYKDLEADPKVFKDIIEILNKLDRKFEPKIFRVLQIANKFGLDMEEGKVKEFFEQVPSYEALVIAQPDFSNFLDILVKGGAEIDLGKNDSTIEYCLRLYRHEGLKELMSKEENILLAEQLNLLKDFYDPEIIKELMLFPNSLLAINRLRQDWGYKPENDNQFYALRKLLKAGNSLENLFKPEIKDLVSYLERFGYRLRFDELSQILEVSLNEKKLQQLSDPKLFEFVMQVADDFSFNTLKAFAELDASYRPIMEELAIKFNLKYNGYNINGKFKSELEKLKNNPEILVAANKFREIGLNFNPMRDLDEITIILAKGLDRLNAGRELLQFIFVNKELVTDAKDKSLSGCLLQILENGKSKSLMGQQMLRGEIVGLLLQEGLFESLSEMENLTTNAEKRSENVENIKKFVEKYNISGKGRTIATLLAMREYRENKNFAELLEEVAVRLEEYRALLENYTPANIPAGLRASIGMEYEITRSTAEGYGFLHQGNNLREDMSVISRFANVGRGNDAVFEIATKPVDNPHLTLLEMQLLQDLEFIDFNFQRPDYEKGARGYHLTIGGEYGVQVGPNVKFLQNALIMAGWGGINAGKSVSHLANARGNIRQRDAHGTARVFENTAPAVELRSLSLDTWEPFERAVETSYLGAIALQAVEKFTDHERLGTYFEIDDVSSPEKFFQTLNKRGMQGAEITDPKVRQIIFEFAKLQVGILEDLKDHNENFLQNEMYGYLDEKGRWVEPADFGGAQNQKRFLESLGTKTQDSFKQDIYIDPQSLFETATEELANKLTSVTNLYIKNPEGQGDIVNATSILDTTKIGKIIEASDSKAKSKSFFDVNGKTREGYYYIQGGSEKMLIHKVQIRLLEFNKAMKGIIS